MVRHIVIYSHGFGTKKDDRGLFTYISNNLPADKHIMFDYNKVDNELNMLSVGSLTEMAHKLDEIIKYTRAEYPDAVIDLICHSQGCVVAGLLAPKGIRKTVFTGPPAMLSKNDLIRLFGMIHGSKINFSGDSTLPRKDGSITIVNKGYWESIKGIDPISLYNGFSKATKLVMVNAVIDEIIGSKDFSKLDKNIKVIELNTGHNFEGNGRVELVKVIAQELREV